MDFNPDEFDQPSMWTTYADLKGPTVALLTQRPPARADDGPLDDFTHAVHALGLHGAIAATALVTEGCGLLGRRLEKHPRTIAALISRIVPWRTPVGVMVNATLSAWVAHNANQAMIWCQKMLDDGDGEFGSLLLEANGGGQARRAGADDDDVGVEDFAGSGVGQG